MHSLILNRQPSENIFQMAVSNFTFESLNYKEILIGNEAATQNSFSFLAYTSRAWEKRMSNLTGKFIIKTEKQN